MDSVSEYLPQESQARRHARPVDAGDRLPPHSPEAEAGVLGCALSNPDECLGLCVERFRGRSGVFYEPQNQTLWAVLQRMYEGHEMVDLITVHQKVKDAGLLEECGGIGRISTLPDMVPSAANLPSWLDLVIMKWKQRKLLQFFNQASERIHTATGNEERLMAELEEEFEGLTAPLQEVKERHIKQVLTDDVLPMIERHYTRGQTQLDGLPTGENWYLDKVLLGIAPADMVILAARPGEGKTSLALNVVDYLATRYRWMDGETERVGLPVGIFTLEMTEESLGFRLVFGHAKISSGRFRQGFASKADFDAIHMAVGQLAESNIYLDGEPAQTMNMIAAKARRWVKQYGIKLFVLDYLQLLDSDESADRLQFLRKASGKIVTLKKRLKVPWLVLAQMNRDIEKADTARRPRLSDLKESGCLEQDADKIIFLYHPLKVEQIEEDEELISDTMKRKHPDTPAEDQPRRINALVAKNRSGPVGKAELLFQNNQCVFHDWRQWKLANGIVQYGKGEREAANPEQEPEQPPEQEI